MGKELCITPSLLKLTWLEAIRPSLREAGNEYSTVLVYHEHQRKFLCQISMVIYASRLSFSKMGCPFRCLEIGAQCLNSTKEDSGFHGHRKMIDDPKKIEKDRSKEKVRFGSVATS